MEDDTRCYSCFTNAGWWFVTKVFINKIISLKISNILSNYLLIYLYKIDILKFETDKK